MDKKTARWIRVSGLLLFIIYLAMLNYFLFFSAAFGRTMNLGREIHYNINPFTEIRRFLTCSAQLGTRAVMVNLLGNVLAFMPLGLILPVIIKNMRKGIRVILWGFLFSMCVESIQLVTRVGSFDVDDIILNTTGVLLGFLLFRLFNRIRREYYG